MKFFLPFLLASLFAPPLSAQGQLLWRKNYGPKGKTITHCFTLENDEQEIALFGLTANQKLYFAILDRDGNILKERLLNLPPGKIEVGIYTPQAYLLAGKKKTETGYSPAIWRMDKEGQSLEALPLPSLKGDGVFYDLATNSKHEIFAAGQLNDQMCLIKLDENFRLHGEKFLTNYLETAAGTAIAINPFDDIFLTGFQRDRKYSKLMVWKFDLKQQLIWNKSFDTIPHSRGSDVLTNARGNDILAMDNGDVAITGVQYSERFNEDAFVLRLAPNGRKPKLRNFSTPANESGGKIIQTLDRNFLIGGESIPFGARTGDLWLNWITKDLSDTLTTIRGTREKRYKNDKITDLLKTRRGDYITAAIFGEGKRRMQLSYYRFAEDLCETRLANKQDFAFSPFLENEVALGSEELTFQGTLLSRFPLNEWDIRITSRMAGEKKLAAPGVLSLEEKATLPNQYCYRLEKTLYLEQGTNLINTIVEKNEKIYRDSILVYNLPRRPNLFLLSIGIIYGDLNYTDEDAHDFTAVFQEQEGRLYDRVYATVMAKKEETQAFKIVDRLLEFKDMADKELQILPEDVLMIFISAHGDITKDGFIIPGSDYRADNPRTQIRFQEEVLDNLKEIKCKKILFIDACKSGAAKGGAENLSANALLAENIYKILATAPGIATLSSSDKDQSSYEHNELENGFFTAAIIEALTQKVTQVDKNSDRIITLGELYQFLQNRIPELVQTFFGDDRVQTPAMPRSDLSESFPLFYINY